LHVNHIDPIAGLPGFWAHQTCLSGSQWNNHLVIFAAEFASALGFQHADHTKGLALNTNCFAGHSICMTKQLRCDIGPKQNHRGAPKHMIFGDKFTFSQIHVSHLEIFRGNADQWT
jgi:hypothetical protein